MGVYVVFLFGLFGSYFLLPIIAAISCAFGKDFRYPIIGNRLANYLGYNPAQAGEEQTWLIEDHEDRWVAAMGHFSVIIALWGMLAPLTAWILQGKRNLLLKVQSAQALVLQAWVALLGFGAGALSLFGFFVFIVLAGFSEDTAINSSSGIAGLVVMLGSMLVALLILLAVPLFHILGQYAGYRVLKGDDYHYPVIGRLVEKWISKTTLKPPSA